MERKVFQIKKIKDLNKINSGNTSERTEKQRDAAQLRMLLDNPMKKPENREKQRQRMLGKNPSNPFPKDNTYWRLRKNLSRKQEEQIHKHHQAIRERLRANQTETILPDKIPLIPTSEQ